MFRKVLLLAVVGLLFVTVDLQAMQINSSWIGNDLDSWGDPSNWNPVIVPDNEDGTANTYVVTISTSENTRIVFNMARTVESLSCSGDVDLEIGGHHLTTETGLTNYGMLQISGSGVEHTVVGDVTNTGTGQLMVSNYVELNGNFANSGTVLAFPDGHLDVLGGDLTNSGNIIIYNSAVGSGGNLENTGSGIIKGTGIIHSNLLFQNQGRIYSYGGSLLVGIGGSFSNSGTIGNTPASSLSLGALGVAEDVNNQGTIEVNAGGGVAFDCNLVNDSSGVIELLGGTLAATTITQTADANFAGFGGITGDITIDPNGLIKLTGPTNIVGDVNIPANATLEISDGQTLITGQTTCNGTIHLIGGTIVFQGGCDCADCNIINEAGIDRNHFDLNADGIEDFKDFASFAESWLWQASWY